MKAVCIWSPGKKSKYSFSTIINLKGFVIFSQDKPSDEVKVVIYINNLKDGFHGIHVHEKSMEEITDLNAANCCNQLGGHFNSGEEKWSCTTPHGTVHGMHTGDLCMNINSENGTAYFSYYDSKISLFNRNKNCILNKTVVIHEDEDDMGLGVYEDEDKNIETLITGNAGKRLACAEIRKILDPDF